MAIASAGCIKHVQLPELPGADAPREQRAAVFHALSPVPTVDMSRQPMETYGRVPLPPGISLNNGLRVSKAIELLPAVHADSPTALFAIAANEHRRSGNIAIGVSLGFFGIGSALLVGGIADLVRFNGQGSRTGNALFYAAAGVIAAAIIPAIAAVFFHMDALTEEQSAFDSYQRDLKSRLGLQEATPPKGSER